MTLEDEYILRLLSLLLIVKIKFCSEAFKCIVNQLTLDQRLWGRDFSEN